jgi:hypothetical protein
MTKTLVGLFFHVADGEYFRTGEIVDEVGAFLLVKFDNMLGRENRMPMELIPLEALAARCEHGNALWSFFNSREALQSWLDWLATPTEEDAAPRDAGRLN